MGGVARWRRNCPAVRRGPSPGRDVPRLLGHRRPAEPGAVERAGSGTGAQIPPADLGGGRRPVGRLRYRRRHADPARRMAQVTGRQSGRRAADGYLCERRGRLDALRHGAQPHRGGGDRSLRGLPLYSADLRQVGPDLTAPAGPAQLRRARPVRQPARQRRPERGRRLPQLPHLPESPRRPDVSAHTAGTKLANPGNDPGAAGQGGEGGHARRPECGSGLHGLASQRQAAGVLAEPHHADVPHGGRRGPRGGGPGLRSGPVCARYRPDVHAAPDQPAGPAGDFPGLVSRREIPVLLLRAAAVARQECAPGIRQGPIRPGAYRVR